MKKVFGIIAGILVCGIVLVFTLLGVKTNLGQLIQKLFGIYPKTKESKVYVNGEPKNRRLIVEDKSPFRDKTILRLDNGVMIKLPDNLQDDQVEKVYVLSKGEYRIVKKDEKRLTDV